MAFFHTPKSSAVPVAAGSATKVPGTALAGRVWLILQIEENGTDPLPTVARHGGPEVTGSIGTRFLEESMPIPCDGDIWVWVDSPCIIQAFEGAP